MSDASLAASAGIPVDILRAIRSIESGGSATSVRFEPHLFFRRVPSARGTIPFTPDPERNVSLVGSETNRAAFERARRIDEDAAIESTSWGRYQVLGSHLLRLYPHDPVGTFDGNPGSVSDEMLVSWFRSRPAAQQAAQQRDIARLAELYNGSVRWGERLAAALDRGVGDIEGAASGSSSWLPWVGAAALWTGVAAVLWWGTRR